MEGVVRENKMGTMKINKLLISMSLPIMISMLVDLIKSRKKSKQDNKQDNSNH